jgi:hypothetical protein
MFRYKYLTTRLNQNNVVVVVGGMDKSEQEKKMEELSSLFFALEKYANVCTK